jgi:hypothetical protein
LLRPSQEKDLIRLKREAKAAKGFYCEPEAKLAFVVRIRGLNKIHPKVRAGGQGRQKKLGKTFFWLVLGVQGAL